MKLLLARIRWGDTLTKQDLALIDCLTLGELFLSSYLIPKTPRIRTSITSRRR